MTISPLIRARSHYFLLLAIGGIACVSGRSNAQPLNGDAPQAATNAQTTEQQAAALLDNAGQAMVQIVDEDKTVGVSITGVTVSADGYVLSRGILGSGNPVKVRFGNGRTVSARPLGWSSEWGIGVWKIVDEGVWPYVELGSTADAQVGQPVVVIDYRTDEESEQTRQLVVRNAAIEHLDPAKWFVTTGVGAEFEHPPLFSVDGTLLGFTTMGYGGDTRKIATAVEVFTENWRDLVTGKNLDWVRFPPREGSDWRPGYESIEQPAAGEDEGQSPDLAAAKKIAHDTTVRILSKSRLDFTGTANERWSGVIVSADGYVLTCGHAEPLPGEQVTVQLSDGRDFNGVVLGSNWISDIAMVKITDSGTWPFAKMIDSSVLEVRDPLVTCGYPAMTPERKVSTDRDPVVSAVRVRSRRPYRLWRSELPMTFDGIRRGGMSGGGVFDSQGRYVGIFLGSEATRSEIARVQWDHLAGNKSSRTPETEGVEPGAN